MALKATLLKGILITLFAVAATTQKDKKKDDKTIQLSYLLYCLTWFYRQESAISQDVNTIN